jgi:hypothetical protein
MKDQYQDDEQECNVDDVRSIGFTAIFMTGLTLMVIACFVPLLKFIM